MKNPLLVYTGAALASLAALAGLSMTDWTTGSPEGQKAPEIVGEAQPQTGEAQPEAGQEAAKAPEKPAETADVKAPGPPKAEAVAKPELDTVRVESDGQAVVAGRAKPGAEIALKLGDKVIGKGLANADGSWVVVPDNPLPKGAHEITVEQKAGDAAPVLAEQSIAVAVPEKAGQQAMVALSKPGAATKVLQAGDSQQQAEATPEKPAEVAETTQPAADSGTAAEPVQKTAEAEQPAQPAAEATQQSAEETVTVAKTEEPATAGKQAEPTQKAAEAAKTTEAVALRLDAVDYNDKGDIIFSGRAAPGTAIRLYVDNGGVGDAIVDSSGNWSFSGSDIIKPGTHTLRADQINKSGKVMARIELPFQREDAAAVAALNAPAETETPKTTEVQKTELPQAVAPQAEPPQTAEVETPTPAEAELPAPADVEQPAPAEPAQTAEAEPQPQATEVAKAEPEASGPAPDQPVAETKTEEVTTAAAATTETAVKATEPDKKRSGKVVIQPGNNLWKLSRVIYGRGINFTVIYKANKDQIRNPNRIYPGQIFAIPNANPPETIDPKRKDPLTSAEGGAAQ